MISVAKIDDVIKLAKQRETLYNANSDTHTIDLALETYLNNLSFDEVKSLQAIMYLGRDKDYDRNLTSQEIYNSQYEYFDRTLGWNTKELEINQMVGKIPLGEYITEGKEILGL